MKTDEKYWMIHDVIHYIGDRYGEDSKKDIIDKLFNFLVDELGSQSISFMSTPHPNADYTVRYLDGAEKIVNKNWKDQIDLKKREIDNERTIL